MPFHLDREQKTQNCVCIYCIYHDFETILLSKCYVRKKGAETATGRKVIGQDNLTAQEKQYCFSSVTVILCDQKCLTIMLYKKKHNFGFNNKKNRFEK